MKKYLANQWKTALKRVFNRKLNTALVWCVPHDKSVKKKSGHYPTPVKNGSESVFQY